MTLQHTPGPWRNEGATVKAISHGIWFKITRADANNYTTEGNEANARLIAAAPCLLLALQECARAINTMPRTKQAEDIQAECGMFSASAAARSAIAKATGEKL